MEIVKLTSGVKNAKKLGFQLYLPICKIGSDYWFCESIKTTERLSKKSIDKSLIIPKRIVPTEYHQANGLI